ncbi:MAG: hypothetical protein ACREL5_10955 [Gemmatimonadales bacterium]
MSRRRFLRATLSLAILWGIGCALLTAALVSVLWMIELRRLVGVEPYVDFVVFRMVAGFVMGAIAGAGFACLLALVERRRSIATLSIWRIAIWGAVAGVVLMLGDRALFPARYTDITTDSFLMALATFAVISGASAAGTLAAARRGEITAGEDADKFLSEVGGTG